MPIGRIAVAAAWFAFISWFAWVTGTTEDGAASGSAVVGVMAVMAWLGGAGVVGYLVGPWAFVLPLVVAIAASAAWQRVDGFSQELAPVNVIAQSTIEAVPMAIGVWLRHRRTRRPAAPSPP